ncbi:MAG: EscU/YscU/HrcU family type III secretion system export apparatus switch protein [Vicinamibacterales bacterium]
MAHQAAGERTEKPTAKRLKEAREKGQVARSRDLSASLSLAGVTLALGWFALRLATLVSERLATGLATLSDQAHVQIVPAGLAGLIWADAGLLARTVGPPAMVAAAVSVAASVAQVGWSYSPKALQLNWGRLSPSQGFSRFAPLQTLPELGKALIGMTAVGALCYFFVREFYDNAPFLMAMSPLEAVRFGWQRVWSLLWRSSLALTALAGLDYLVHYFRTMSQLKMTRNEVRDEAKSQEGNPEIKARVRRIQRDMARRRMLHAVKTATVVVTNPTHFAVALTYRREDMSAPVLVAKGQDELAARIRAMARAHNVPLVENVALARALYKSAEVGEAIPAALFGAVAEVLAYLVRLKQLIL